MELKRIDKRVKMVDIDDLKQWPGNPRRNNKSAKMVAESIKAFGYINPIIVTEDNYILAGNTRHKALKLLGVTGEIDVIEVSGLTVEQKSSFVIVDNRVGEYSQWNYAAIDRMVTEMKGNETLKTMGMSSFKDNKKELEALIND